MSRSAKAVLAAAAVPLMIAGCSGGTVAAQHARAAIRIGRCPGRALVLHPGTYVSPATGEHAAMYALTNRGQVACTLKGYPQVVLTDATGAVLPFRYTKGGGAYVTSAPPVSVVLAHGASACDAMLLPMARALCRAADRCCRCRHRRCRPRLTCRSALLRRPCLGRGYSTGRGRPSCKSATGAVTATRQRRPGRSLRAALTVCR
jgi:hypothetical protein